MGVVKTLSHSKFERMEEKPGKQELKTGYKFPGHSYMTPDVSVTNAGQAEGKYLEGVPAIAIEIVSPGNTVRLMDA